MLGENAIRRQSWLAPVLEPVRQRRKRCRASAILNRSGTRNNLLSLRDPGSRTGATPARFFPYLFPLACSLSPVPSPQFFPRFLCHAVAKVHAYTCRNQPYEFMPRPNILDEPKRREIIALISMGCSRTVAAGYVGCAVSTIRYTAEHDPTFDEQLRQAAVRPQVWHLQNIAKHAARSWKASAWMLERLYPHQFERRKPDSVSRDDVQKTIQLIMNVVGKIPDQNIRREVHRRMDDISAAIDGWAAEHAAPWERDEDLCEQADVYEPGDRDPDEPRQPTRAEAAAAAKRADFERRKKAAKEWAETRSSHPLAVDNPINWTKLSPERRKDFGFHPTIDPLGSRRAEIEAQARAAQARVRPADAAPTTANVFGVSSPHDDPIGSDRLADRASELGDIEDPYELFARYEKIFGPVPRHGPPPDTPRADDG